MKSAFLVAVFCLSVGRLSWANPILFTDRAAFEAAELPNAVITFDQSPLDCSSSLVLFALGAQLLVGIRR
jgi:hypothetical protein